MKSILVVCFVLCGLVCKEGISQGNQAKAGLTVEIRLSANKVALKDSLVATVILRSPTRVTWIWDSLTFGPATGLLLTAYDASGKQAGRYMEFEDIMPPDPSGKGSLLHFGGDAFVGFDTRIPVSQLVKKPGVYRIKCIYRSPFPRNYFEGITIWGKEDGPVESEPVFLTVN